MNILKNLSMATAGVIVVTLGIVSKVHAVTLGFEGVGGSIPVWQKHHATSNAPLR